jgi:hypothetical protein
LGIKHPLLERVDLKSCENVDLLNKQWWSVLFPKFLSDLRQNPCRICVLVGFTVELDCLHLFVLFDQVVSIPLQQLLDLQKVMLFSEFDSHVPLVKQYTAVNRFLHFPHLEVGLASRLTEPHRLESFTERI